jgi:hypothetical protein
VKASNTDPSDYFGLRVAISGDTMVVGAYGEDSTATGVNGPINNNDAPDSGAAYVFVRTGPNWTQQVYLKASNSGDGDYFGLAVAICGDTIVIGAPYEDGNSDSAPNSGAAYVFVRSGTNWAQQAYLKASNAEAAQVGDLNQAQLFTLFIWAHAEWQRARGKAFSLPVNDQGMQFATYHERPYPMKETP